jgi:hypothetical protein
MNTRIMNSESPWNLHAYYGFLFAEAFGACSEERKINEPLGALLRRTKMRPYQDSVHVRDYSKRLNAMRPMIARNLDT